MPRPFVRKDDLCYLNAMRHDPLYRPITVGAFHEIDFGTDHKFELVDGMIRMMTGGTPAHSRVASNILSFLGAKLRGSGCRAYNSDMGINVGDENVRYPDVAVFCQPATIERERRKTYDDPVAIFEVLSASTTRSDQGDKLALYRQLASLDTIVFVDPEEELTRIVQHLGPQSWRDDLFARRDDVALPILRLAIPHVEIFARD